MMRALLLTVLLGVTAANAQEAENPLQPSPAWEDLRSSIIGTETDPRSIRRCCCSMRPNAPIIPPSCLSG
ncbi:hypothetical protein QWZ10_15215 [Paracoccus cavernae]|uniref:Uncharacterized protein n=1 Tax=Paracoccus cavernae TaxID=1571207 RepID=A0ABT8D8F3_9RHOB|nr:hypothetical protein [Paracoccus cavernae]